MKSLSGFLLGLRLGLEKGQKFIVILVHSSVCPLPFNLDPSIKALTHISFHSTISSKDLYEEVMGVALPAGEIAVVIPAEITLYLHESFIRSHCCVKTIIDRLV